MHQAEGNREGVPEGHSARKAQLDVSHAVCGPAVECVLASCTCLAQIDLMKEQGFLDKKFNRRRDEFVMYVEASCKMAHLTKGPVAQK